MDTVRRDFAAFLKARREAIDPAELGLPSTGRRRTPGLRREEIAQLAGVSVDYYTRLEQARDLRPSAAVLESLARALRLTPTERDHLLRLGRATPAGPRPAGPERVRPTTRRVLDAVLPAPALVLGRRMDVLAWNRTATALLGDFEAVPRARRNMALLVFLDPAVRDRHAEWERVGRDIVAMLRYTGSRFPDDPGLAALIGELSLKSPEFRAWWSRQEVRVKTTGTKTFAHPEVGHVALDFEAFPVPATDQQLIIYTAPADSPARAALDLLAAACI